MFGFNKKNEAPPDVGEEDKYEEMNSEEKSDDKMVPSFPIDENNSISHNSISQNSSPQNFSSLGDSQMNIKIEQLNAKLETVTNWMKQVYERFSYISESIGEMRSMNLNNEKQIAKAIKDANQASEIVKEVQPAVLRLDYKKANLRMDVLDEKLEANKQFTESVLEQFKDIQRKAEVFIGTEGVLKLNDDTKKELIEIQKLASRARLDADKSEQIFMELKKTLADMQKMNSEFVSFNNTSTMIKKDIEKIRIDHSKVIGEEEFADLKKIIDRKFSTMDSYMGAVEGIKKTNERLTDLIEKILRMTKSNKENIDSIALTIGKDNLKKVSDYDGQIDGILKLVDSLAGQISEIKKQIGMKPNISVDKSREPAMIKNNLNMQNISVPKNIIKQIVPKKETVVPKMSVSKVIDKKPEINKISNPPVKNNSFIKSIISRGDKKLVEKIVEKEEYPEDKEISQLQKRISKLSSEI